jgi:hypothetical protein
MRRLALALAGIIMAIQADSAWSGEPVLLDPAFEPPYPSDVCWPLPLSYPRGWEIVIHTPCPAGYYLPRFHHAPNGYWPSHGYSRSVYRAARVAHVGATHRRPYLRPGWWW